MTIMDREHCIELLESAATHPHEGLPPDVFRFVSRITPLINVDLLVQDDQGRTLLTWRDDEWFGAPSPHIIEQAQRVSADYIVMGSHGHTALYDLIVGSTTHGELYLSV